MLRLLADENFHGAILGGLRRRLPLVDIVWVQDTVIAGSDDVTVLAWAAIQGRIILTHDIRTLLPDARRRLLLGDTVPGVFAVPQDAPIGAVIADLALIVECSTPDEWLGRIIFLPLA